MNDSTAVLPTLKSPPSEMESGVRDASRLEGSVVRVTELTETDRAGMYGLLEMYFARTTRQQFDGDLAEKEWAILLRDSESGGVQGFSTLMRFSVEIENQPVVAFFSGDTIIAREYWGETTLPRLWGRHVFRLADEIHDARVYWFLICSGYKTYRFLPVFFREFYPHCERPMPAAIRQLLDTLGRLKFKNEYDAGRGVVRFAHATPLHEGVADITEQRLRDPHVAFFARANPGHARGDELACLCEITRGNLTPAGRRMVGEPSHGSSDHAATVSE
ncbi:MAG TPA: hypothetical protein VFD58_19515 [Blastocatellia bacterium]|nr:hypothetical protein [Blastocatellia bacterium]